MKFLSFLAKIIVLYLLFAVASCKNKCTKAEGELNSKIYNYSTFIKGIEVFLPANVFIELISGEKSSLEIITNNNVQSEINVVNNKGIINVSLAKCVENIGEIKIYFKTPNIEIISASSTGTIVSKVLVSDSLNINLYDKSSADLLLNTKKTYINHTSDKNLSLTGFSNYLESSVNSYGSILAYSTILDSAIVDMNGWGDVEVRINSKLYANFIGDAIGNIKYKGSSAVVVNDGYKEAIKE